MSSDGAAASFVLGIRDLTIPQCRAMKRAPYTAQANDATAPRPRPWSEPADRRTGMSGHHAGTPVRRRLWTPAYRTLTLVGLIATLMVAVRFGTGLGPMTNMTDVFPWGTWKVFNVIVLTALGSGGYALAFVTYVMNRGRYHPLVRHGLLTSAVGYTMGAISLATDIGR